MIKAVRGTRDLLPPETGLWNFVEAKVRAVFRAYNFQEIRTPIFEATDLVARGVGEETDIVAKEMYTWSEGIAPNLELYYQWRSLYGQEFEIRSQLTSSQAGSQIDTLKDSVPYLIEVVFRP